MGRRMRYRGCWGARFEKSLHVSLIAIHGYARFKGVRDKALFCMDTSY